MMLDVATLHRRARRVLPDKIQTRGVVIDAVDEKRLAALLLPLGRCRRGAILFELSSATLSALATRSLAFLQDALTAREGLARQAAPLAYHAWQAVSQGAFEGFRTTSRDGRASLWLAPCAGLAMYAWDDRGLAAPTQDPS
ncbi:hypothetical protein OVA13_07160 [Pseudoxanthomonas sp. SL93]|uniref:hypothetical protein n=1 Tax=Pseudoxanthomonas sp. SL93 TaxID=2995142 RepID=UPI00227082D4|nr:hypothetical protein [Pseudoxanthomonas sp. SL93]WAC64527.1 hypothetical protein OVA13_07160 [Pseudoxanthomonas sp. SL93]